MNRQAKNNSRSLLALLFAFSLAFLFAALLAPDRADLWSGLLRLCSSPAQLTVDYFALGGLSAAFFNTGLVGLTCCILLTFSRADCNGVTFAAYWLNTGFGTFGMTVPVMLPFFLGTWLYARLKKRPFRELANTALFSTALAPFVSELLFRYPIQEPHTLTPLGIFGALLLGVTVGLAMPALCAHSPALHKGYNLYNAGPAAGFLSFLVYCLLYRSVGIEPPTNTMLGNGERSFVGIFFLLLFLSCLVLAYRMDKHCLQKYKQLWQSNSYRVDYTVVYGLPATLLNCGIYGLFILCYYLYARGVTLVNGTITLTSAAFTGATMGAIMCMFALAAVGGQPRTVFPILLGYALASLLPLGVCALGLTETVSWSLTSQAILVGLCFASGLAPITGKWGTLAGIAAGALHALLVTSVPLLHGGFCFYNGGFTAGLVAFLLVPLLECFSPRNKQ